MEASLLYTTVAIVLVPPDVEKTRSENEACSISVRVCVCVFVYMRLCIGFFVRVCVLDWVRVFVCQCMCLRVEACVSEACYLSISLSLGSLFSRSR